MPALVLLGLAWFAAAVSLARRPPVEPPAPLVLVGAHYYPWYD